jgi:hypothetical protein
MLNVLLTIDTEVYPLHADWRADRLARDIARDIYGQTQRRAVGLNYQIEVLNRFGLKAVFFVESLFAEAVGGGPLERMVDEIQSAGHEAQLHLHPEWLEWMDAPPVPKLGRETIREYAPAEQAQLVAVGLRNLRRAGATDVNAFRAGDFAAGAATFSALHENGIAFDTSYNACHRGSLADVAGISGQTQPRRVAGLWEFPVSCWDAGFGHRRAAQVCSCSSGELQGALLAAWHEKWHSFVIVSHSFELLKKRRRRVSCPVPDPLVVRRFETLCEFLGQHRDKFRTSGFHDIEVNELYELPQKPSFRSPLRRTAWRVMEQAYRRLA